MLSFLKQTFADHYHTGAVMPSSAGLARAMTQSVRCNSNAKRVLEVGPGTGPVTKWILRSLRPGDELQIVEINPRFCDQLEGHVLRPFRRLHPDITVELHCAALQDAALSGEFDHVVCSLPFNNFGSAMTRTMVRQMFACLKPGGDLTYFEYQAQRPLKAPFIGERGRRKDQRMAATHSTLYRRYGHSRSRVFLNMPPAVAIRLVKPLTTGERVKRMQVQP